MWKFAYFKSDSYKKGYDHNYEITEPIEAATIDTAKTKKEAIKKVNKENKNLVDYLINKSTLEAWKDYFTQ